MIAYKLDKTKQAKTVTHIRDMNGVLMEIAPTLRVLQDLLNEHQASISEQNINQYRDDMKRMIAEAIRLTHLIATNSQRLSNVSDRTAKQLSVIQDQAAEGLKGRIFEPSALQTTQSTIDSPAKSSVTGTTNHRTMRFTKTLTRG